MPHLVALGLEIERPRFHIPVGMEMRQSTLRVRIGGVEEEVAADSMLSETNSLVAAMQLDTDGVVNDTEPDPIEAVGPAIVVLDDGDIDSLNPSVAADSIIFADYGLFDFNIRRYDEILERGGRLIQARPEAIVLVTRYSNVLDESHGVGATGAHVFASRADAPPILTVQLENLSDLGINDLADLNLIEYARVTVDTDIFAPGTSGNLIARIPGEDPSRAIVVSAHIDSFNTPGALDDGSGSVAALEVARVLDELEMQPPIDLYLAWFGSHERGLYGSGNFVTTHGEILDRAVAIIQNDCLTVPIEGIEPIVVVQTWGSGRFGDSRTPLSDHLRALGLGFGLDTERFSHTYFSSDSASAAAFDVDVVPYGRPVAAADLVDADLVVVLPAFDYPSVEGMDTVFVRYLNSVPFTISHGTVIASSGNDPVIASVPHDGGGEVIVIGDIGIFGEDFQGPTNLQLSLNLAAYARNRR